MIQFQFSRSIIYDKYETPTLKQSISNPRCRTINVTSKTIVVGGKKKEKKEKDKNKTKTVVTKYEVVCYKYRMACN